MKNLFLLITLIGSLFLAGCSDTKPSTENVPTTETKETHQNHDHDNGDHDHDHPHDDTGNHEGHNHPHDEQGHNHNHEDIQAAFKTLQFTSSVSQNINNLALTIEHKDPHVGDNISFKVTAAGINGFDKVDGEIGNLVYRKKGTSSFSDSHPVANTANSLSWLLSFQEAAEYEIVAQFVINGEEIMVPYILKVHAEGDHDHE